MGDADLSLEITNTLIPNITQKIHAEIIRLPRLKEVRRTASQVRHEPDWLPRRGSNQGAQALVTGAAREDSLPEP